MASTFPDPLHSDLLDAINNWRDHPELSRLAAKIHAHTESAGFLDSCCEAVIARRLLKAGGELLYEISTPSGKQCDFQLCVDNATLYLHVKRLDSSRAEERHITISSRLRYLERIPRPYVVQIRWSGGTSDRSMQRLVREAADFILQARVGDEHRIHDEDDREIGGVRIVAPGNGDFVNLVIGLPSGFTDETRRIRRLLDRAHLQFMPRAINVILLGTSSREEQTDLENALLGDHIERWDAHPPQGRRIAHGRAEDGFWQGNRCPDSQAAAWFHFDPEPPEANPDQRLFLRSRHEFTDSTMAILTRLFSNPL